MQGIAVAVREAQTLAIESPTGCNLQVLSGRAWITAEGRLRDIVADAEASVPIGPGVRCNVSALYGVVTVLITLPCRTLDARVELHARGGAGRLVVTSGRKPFFARLSRVSALVDGVAKRLFEARSA
jgi:hypothetical protein